MKKTMTILAAMAALAISGGAAMADGGEIDGYTQSVQAKYWASRAPAAVAQAGTTSDGPARTQITLFGRFHDASSPSQPVQLGADGNGR